VVVAKILWSFYSIKINANELGRVDDWRNKVETFAWEFIASDFGIC
jgi:hypothetical protein